MSCCCPGTSRTRSCASRRLIVSSADGSSSRFPRPPSYDAPAVTSATRHMRIAFVSNPWVTLPEDAAFGGEQAWTYQVGRRLAERAEVIVYSRSRRAAGGAATRMDDGVLYRQVAAPGLGKVVKLAGRLGNVRRPFFASAGFQLPYALRVALDVRQRRCDVVHIHDMSQFVPLVRALNPTSLIVLHMQVEWLTQLDRPTIARR